jgi:hypothetical protein
MHRAVTINPCWDQFPAGGAEEAADGQLIWVEGSVEEEAVHHIGSTVQQKQQEEPKYEHFEIPE